MNPCNCFSGGTQGQLLPTLKSSGFLLATGDFKYYSTGYFVDELSNKDF